MWRERQEELHHIFSELLFSGSKNRYYSKSLLIYIKNVNQIASLDWFQFVLDKLINSVRHYKETKDAKGMYFDGQFFFLMVSSPIKQPMPSKISDHYMQTHWSLIKECKNVLVINN